MQILKNMILQRKKKFSTLFRHQTLHLCSGFIGDPLGQWNASENDLELIAIPFGLKIKTSHNIHNLSIYTHYIYSVVVQDCIKSSLLCEPVSLQVPIATSCDAVGAHNRQDLIHSLVQTQYVCNKFI